MIHFSRREKEVHSYFDLLLLSIVLFEILTRDSLFGATHIESMTCKLKKERLISQLRMTNRLRDNNQGKKPRPNGSK